MILESDSALSHGRIPTHEIQESMKLSLLLLKAKANLSRHRVRMLSIGFDTGLWLNTQQSALPRAARAYREMISYHFMSYDSFSRPYKFYELPKVHSPHHQFSSHGYY